MKKAVGKNDFEKMISRKYEYVKGLNGHTEIALYEQTVWEIKEIYNFEFAEQKQV